MTDQDNSPMNDFAPGTVLCFGGFHQDIIGMAAGLCSAGVFVRKFDQHGHLITALVVVQSRIEELYGYEGESGLLKAMLERQQIEVSHLMNLIEKDSGETRMQALFVAGTKLGKRDHEPYDARLRPVLRSLNPGECRKIVSDCSENWLIRLLIEECRDFDVLNDIAKRKLRPDLSRGLRRAAERRSLEFPA